MHQQHPLLSTFDRAQVASHFEYVRTETVGGDAVFNAVLHRMAAAGSISLTEQGVALAGRGPQLSRQQRDLLEQIVDGYRQAGFQPPTLEEVQRQASRNQAAVPELLKLAVADGRLVRIDADLCLHAEWEQRMRAKLAEPLTGSDGLTVSQIREMLGTTRKYAVPLCEYLDRIGFTQRRGEVRVRKGG
jgi:selenocysteine-specific elongation factor